MPHWKMSGHISLAAPPGCRVESWTSAVLASRGCVCPVGQLQDRRLVLTEPLRTAQRQGGFDGLPWGKKNKRLHVIPFFQASSRLLREHLQIRRRLHQTFAAHTSGPVPVDRPTLRRHKFSQQVCCRHFGQALEYCQPIWRQLFITSQTKMCEMFSNTCRMWRRCCLAMGTRVHHLFARAPFKINDVVGN